MLDKGQTAENRFGEILDQYAAQCTADIKDHFERLIGTNEDAIAKRGARFVEMTRKEWADTYKKFDDGTYEKAIRDGKDVDIRVKQVWDMPKGIGSGTGYDSKKDEVYFYIDGQLEHERVFTPEIPKKDRGKEAESMFGHVLEQDAPSYEPEFTC